MAIDKWKKIRSVAMQVLQNLCLFFCGDFTVRASKSERNSIKIMTKNSVFKKICELYPGINFIADCREIRET